MLIKPNDLGNNLVLENLRKLKIEDYVREVGGRLKKSLLEAELKIDGINVGLTTSKTRFGGKRLWFRCPGCGRRVGVLYRGLESVGCRKCLGIRYRGERYKGMLEVQ
jgi:hypothetical protein